ncbi:DUF5710 domain-containing protein [Leucobacter sp. GX0328]
MKYWLEVSFDEKDVAKAAGARWDPVARRWYATEATIGALLPWHLPPLPSAAASEDRSFGGGLYVDLVPQSCWFTNVRSCVSKRDWNRIRRMMSDRAGHQCEICGSRRDKEAKRWLEAHERWDYDEEQAIQTLRRLILLCTDCHTATHFGHASLRGKEDIATFVLARVNNWSAQELMDHIDQAFIDWRRRSQLSWRLDISLLDDLGIVYEAVPDPERRGELSGMRLQQGALSLPEAVVLPVADNHLPQERKRGRRFNWFRRQSR